MDTQTVETPPMPEVLIKIPISASTFYAPEAKKHFWVLSPEDLSLDRYEALEEKTIEFLFCKDYKALIEDISKAMEFCKNGKTYDAHTLLFNVIWSMSNTQARKKFALMLCTIFIVGEGESKWEYDEIIAKAKIETWRREFAADFFIKSAVRLLGGHKSLASYILGAFLGKEAAEHYLKQQQMVLENLIKFGQQED